MTQFQEIKPHFLESSDYHTIFVMIFRAKENALKKAASLISNSISNSNNSTEYQIHHNQEKKKIHVLLMVHQIWRSFPTAISFAVL